MEVRQVVPEFDIGRVSHWFGEALVTRMWCPMHGTDVAKSNCQIDLPPSRWLDDIHSLWVGAVWRPVK